MRIRHFMLGCLAVILMASLTFAMGSKTAKESKKHPSPTAMKQGVHGRVEIWEGNFMPSTDPKSSSSKITPGNGRKVRVHQPLILGGGMHEARRDSVPTPLVAETVCDSAGFFFIPLAPADYSIFVEEKNGWYYNGWNGKGVQGGITVKPDSVSETLIKITTKAVF